MKTYKLKVNRMTERFNETYFIVLNAVSVEDAIKNANVEKEARIISVTETDEKELELWKRIHRRPSVKTGNKNK